MTKTEEIQKKSSGVWQRVTPLVFLIIAAVYMGIAALYAVRVPDWQTPDEPAHYNYIRQVAEEGIFPTIEMGDWDQGYLDDLRAARFDPLLLVNLHLIEYEDHQPPLYYVLAAPIYTLTNGSLTALRLFSAALGLIIVWSAWQVGRLMYPNQPWIAGSAAAFVAFLPQHIHILASVNNDSLGWAVVGVTLVGTVAYLKNQLLWGRTVQPWMLGLLVGIGFITKSTTYFMAAIVLLAIVLRWWEGNLPLPLTPSPLQWGGGRRALRGGGGELLLRQIAAFLIPALILGLLWWGRNIDVYGFPDFLGLRAHDSVVVGQPRTAEAIERLGFSAYLENAARITFQSFWGQFGWMGVPLQSIYYMAFAAFMGFALAGVGIFGIWGRGMIYHAPTEPDKLKDQRSAWIILMLTIVLSVLAYLYYNTEFEQYQGRYMFPMLIPLGLVLAVGLDGWRRLIQRWVQLPALFPWAIVLIYLPLALLDVWLLWRVIVPNLQIL